MIDKGVFIDLVNDYVNRGAKNYVDKKTALAPELEGLRIFDEPLIGFAAADDEDFIKLKSEKAVGSHFLLPRDWNNSAKTVISIFCPFTRRIKDSNKAVSGLPSFEWLHGRIEGQAFLADLLRRLQAFLEGEGYKTAVPCLDPRFSQKSPYSDNSREQGFYTSNWSERHVAFTAGLGTFGLSRGLITPRGIAGRIGSLITEAFFEADPKIPKKLYENCLFCGRCVSNCPVEAISLKDGKKHPPCSDFLDAVKEKFNPWYGCGKCQVNVPCENGIPPALAAGKAQS
ncbi:MAG: 4Fe-4S binding protein [Spirochaetales bacterium]|nr:4Fe-4S binding protein [Spirochaetales bacterium]